MPTSGGFDLGARFLRSAKKKRPPETGPDAVDNEITVHFEEEDDAQAQMARDYLSGEGYQRVDVAGSGSAADAAAAAGTMITQTQDASSPGGAGTAGSVNNPNPAAATTVAVPTNNNTNNTATAVQTGATAASTVAASPVTTDSALMQAIEARWNLIKGDAATVAQEFDWQRLCEGEQTKTDAFKAEVLHPGPRLRVFALVPEGGAHVQFIYAAGAFYDIGGPQNLNNKIIGFSGDRSSHCRPSSYVLQPDNTWDWKKVNACFEDATFCNHFAKEEHRGKLWTPDPAAPRLDKQLPRMVLLPTAVLHELGVQVLEECTSWDIYKAVVRLLLRQGFPASADQCRFLKEWAMAAIQAAPGKSSADLHLKLGPTATTNRAFHDWTRYMINAVLGPETQQLQSGGGYASQAGISPELAEALKTMTRMAETSIILAGQSKKAAEQGREVANEIMKEEKSKFSDHLIAAICGFCKVTSPEDIPDLWREFDQHSAPAAWRADLLVAMEEWADVNKIVLERNLYFTDQWLKDIVKGLFNPGGARASYATAEKGISPLPCRPRSSTEVESIIAFQQASNDSAANRTLSESLKLGESTPRSPPTDYHDLCTMLGTFAALLFALFGGRCEFFAAVFDLYKVLISPRVVDIKGCFNSLYCKQITWAVIEEGRTFFGTQLHPRVFQPEFSGQIDWPSCLLQTINREVIFGLPIIRQTFPLAWSELKTQQVPRGTQQLQLPQAPVAPQPIAPSPFVRQNAPVTSLSPTSLDHVHPRIRELLKPMHARLQGRIPMKKILKLGGVDFPALPKLQRCIHKGKNKLCYQYICGVCPRGADCFMHKEAQGHAAYAELDCVDPATGRHFIDHLWDVIKPGVDYIVTNGDDFDLKESRPEAVDSNSNNKNKKRKSV